MLGVLSHRLLPVQPSPGTLERLRGRSSRRTTTRNRRVGPHLSAIAKPELHVACDICPYRSAGWMERVLVVERDDLTRSERDLHVEASHRGAGPELDERDAAAHSLGALLVGPVVVRVDRRDA